MDKSRNFSLRDFFKKRVVPSFGNGRQIASFKGSLAEFLRHEWFLSLTFKYILQLVSVGVILSVLLIGYASYNQRRIVFGEMEKRVALLGQSLAGEAGVPYFLRDFKTLRQIFSRTLRIRGEDIGTIVLLDEAGKVVMHVGEESVANKTYLGQRSKKSADVWRDSEYVHVLAPLVIQLQERTAGVSELFSGEALDPNAVRSELQGYIYLNLSLTRAKVAVMRLIRHSVGVTLVIILLVGSLVGLFFFRRTFVHPLRKLIGAMTQVRRGNLFTSLERTGQSHEIDTLTRTFNEMTQDLRRAEDKLIQANADLEKRVLERTRDLEFANQELIESHEKVIRTEKLAAIGQLASGVGHELRNPLGTIRNTIYYIRDMLKDHSPVKEDKTLEELLVLADREVQSATKIISDLLEFSRVMKLNIASTNINRLLRDVKALIVFPKNVRVSEEFQENLPEVNIDPQRIKQVFINLMTNAIQAMPKGGELKIATRMDGTPEDSSSQLCVDFIDKGTGISESNRKRIFEPLFTTKARGTGLGLSISLGIVTAHGGRIDVVSVPDKGSTFTVRLPLYVDLNKESESVILHRDG